jgi:hypothetical protein
LKRGTISPLIEVRDQQEPWERAESFGPIRFEGMLWDEHIITPPAIASCGHSFLASRLIDLVRRDGVEPCGLVFAWSPRK